MRKSGIPVFSVAASVGIRARIPHARPTHWRGNPLWRPAPFGIRPRPPLSFFCAHALEGPRTMQKKKKSGWPLPPRAVPSHRLSRCEALGFPPRRWAGQRRGGAHRQNRTPTHNLTRCAVLPVRLFPPFSPLPCPPIPRAAAAVGLDVVSALLPTALLIQHTNPTRSNAQGRNADGYAVT